MIAEEHATHVILAAATALNNSQSFNNSQLSDFLDPTNTFHPEYALLWFNDEVR